jgi:hypothetical protein
VSRAWQRAVELHKVAAEEGQTMRYGDAFDRLGQLRSDTQKLVDVFLRTESPAPAATMKKILLAFELRWKLEELVLMPALKDTQGVILCGTRDAQRELAALRELGGLARQPNLSPECLGGLLSAINDLAALRTQRVSLALTRARRAGLVDTRQLGVEMDRLLERWHFEIRRNADGADDDEIHNQSLAPRRSGLAGVGSRSYPVESC